MIFCSLKIDFLKFLCYLLQINLMEGWWRKKKKLGGGPNTPVGGLLKHSNGDINFIYIIGMEIRRSERLSSVIRFVYSVYNLESNKLCCLNFFKLYRYLPKNGVGTEETGIKINGLWCPLHIPHIIASLLPYMVYL
jgi:hypothetical protein